MPIVGLSSTWWKRKGAGVGSLPTCDHVWNAKTTLWNNAFGSKTWTDNPAYEPIQNISDVTTTVLIDSEDEPWPFIKLGSPAILTRSKIKIQTNTMTEPFEIYLGRGGPSNEWEVSDVPVLQKRLFHIPVPSDPSYPANGVFSFPSGGSSGDDVAELLFGGHNYGLVFQSLDTDTVPSGTIDWSMSCVFQFGGAGS